MRKLLVVVPLAVALLAGCAHHLETVTLPPEAPMEGIQRIAIVGFSNRTEDPTLHRAFMEELARELGRTYEIVDQAEADAAFAALGVSPEELTVPHVAQALGERLNADAIITGAAIHFAHGSTVLELCSSCPIPRTSYGLLTVVLVEFEARLIRTSDGAIVWSNTLEEKGIAGSSHPWHPGDSRLDDVPIARERAVQNAAVTFSKDLLPRRVTRPKENR